MRAIDDHVHPMKLAYVDASAPFMPTARPMFKGRFEASPDLQIVEDFRRDDTTRMLKLEAAVAPATAVKA